MSAGSVTGKCEIKTHPPLKLEADMYINEHTSQHRFAMRVDFGGDIGRVVVFFHDRSAIGRLIKEYRGQYPLTVWPLHNWRRSEVS